MHQDPPSQGRLAGIDFGTVRIGIAITDPQRTLASPHENYTRRDAAADARHFQQLVEQERIVGFVVGLPVHTSGEESEKSRQARRFGKWLADTTGVTVCFFDERFTSRQADELLSQARLTKKKRKQRRDMLAAQLMLAAYLESQRSRQQDAEPLED